MGSARITHNAESLVRWIREHSGDNFHIEVAAYPEVHPDAASAESDLEFFRAKVEAGADSAITRPRARVRSSSASMRRAFCSSAWRIFARKPGCSKKSSLSFIAQTEIKHTQHHARITQ